MRKMVVVLALMFIASCARVPIPTEQGYPLSYQEKMQASEHWRVSAEVISEQVKLAISPEGKNAIQVKDKIFVYDGDQTTFGKAMRTFLITELQKQGMVPSEDPQSPYILRWDVQEVYHYAAREGKYTPHSEIIISYALISAGGSKYFAQVYYVNDVDINQYGYEVRTPPPPPPPPSLHPTTYTVTNR
jgi:hypothetical protein